LRTGYWRESYETPSGKALDVCRIARVAAIALCLAVSPVTAMLDPWWLERKRRDAAVTVVSYQPVVGRYVSRSDALRIAREILAHAERQRLAVADFEAAKGIQWGDET
jgi:hypothetical protein